MRVLVIPEFYRPGDPTGNGTVNDVLAWIHEWLERDRRLHVYVLVPSVPSGQPDPFEEFEDCERVTTIEAPPAFDDLDRREPFTDTGYSAPQLRALRREIADEGAYVDVVVDQLRFGRETLYKSLLDSSDHWAAEVPPVDVVANVHDLQVPPKYRFCEYRNDYQFRLEAAGAAFCDGVWFTSGVDAGAFREHVDFLAPTLRERVLDGAVIAGAPVDFDRFEKQYATRPQWLHLAGSFWEKKNVDRCFSVAETLHEEYETQTLLTSVDPVPARYGEPEWVTAHGEASRATYEDALARGDLAVHASAYETMPRTPVEQAAAGQVLVLPDEPWTREWTPEAYPYRVPRGDLASGAVEAVEGWDAAVRANRRLVAHARSIRGTEACGRRTYRDLHRRVEEKLSRYGEGKRPRIVTRAIDDLDDRFELDAAIARTARYTDDGRPLTDAEDYATIDLVYTLRSSGYVDVGNPGTPAFELA